MQQPSSGKGDFKTLYVCLEEKSDNAFFASLDSLDGLVASLRSSTSVHRGATVYIAPVPDGWAGEQITPEQVMNSRSLKCGLVSRTERSTFTLRLLTGEAQHTRKQIRDGTMGLDDLTVRVSEAGPVTTIRVTGGLGLSSLTRLQSAFSRLKPSQLLILLDLTDMTVTYDTAAGLLIRFIRESETNERAICVLSRPISRFTEILEETKSPGTIKIHTKRDLAVASLLKGTLED